MANTELEEAVASLSKLRSSMLLELEDFDDRMARDDGDLYVGWSYWGVGECEDFVKGIIDAISPVIDKLSDLHSE